MKRIAITCFALVALLAASAAAAGSASAEKLTLSEGGTALEAGNTFEIYGFDNLFVTTSEGAIECPTSFAGTALEVSVLTNSKGLDEVQIKHIYGGNLPEPCRSFTGNAGVSLESLGAILRLRATGKAAVGPVVLLIHFEHEEYQGIRYSNIQCVYKAFRLHGTNTATTTLQKLRIELEGKLALDGSLSSEKAKHLCPAEAGMSLSLPSTQNEVENEVIDEQTHTASA
jgi:hypothetical protein